MCEDEDSAIDISIDLCLLNKDLEENVDQGDLDSLEHCLLSDGSSTAASHLQLNDLTTPTDLISINAAYDDNTSATDFIGLYSTINVTTNVNFAIILLPHQNTYLIYTR